jgi:hypothetical protein
MVSEQGFEGMDGVSRVTGIASRNGKIAAVVQEKGVVRAK